MGIQLWRVLRGGDSPSRHAPPLQELHRHSLWPRRRSWSLLASQRGNRSPWREGQAILAGSHWEGAARRQGACAAFSGIIVDHSGNIPWITLIPLGGLPLPVAWRVNGNCAETRRGLKAFARDRVKMPQGISGLQPRLAATGRLASLFVPSFSCSPFLNPIDSYSLVGLFQQHSESIYTCRVSHSQHRWVSRYLHSGVSRSIHHKCVFSYIAATKIPISRSMYKRRYNVTSLNGKPRD